MARRTDADGHGGIEDPDDAAAPPDQATPPQAPQAPQVPAEPVTGEVVTFTPAAARKGDLGLLGVLQQGAEPPEPDTDELYKRILAQILSASTPEEVLTSIEAVGAREMVGVPLLVGGWANNESEFEQGSPVYATLDAVRLDTTERVKINCGSQKVLAKLIRLTQLEEIKRAESEGRPPAFRIDRETYFDGEYKCKFITGKRPNQYGTLPLDLISLDD